MRHFFKILFFSSLIFTINVNRCSAIEALTESEPNASVVVKDTAGIVRANEKVEEKGVVTFSLVDASGAPAEGVEVSLVMEGTGETLTGISQAGTVTFEGVASGAWVVSSATPGITFTEVSILPSSALAAGGGISIAGVGIAPVAIGGAAVAGAAAIAISANNSDNNNNDEPLSKFR